MQYDFPESSCQVSPVLVTSLQGYPVPTMFHLHQMSGAPLHWDTRLPPIPPQSVHLPKETRQRKKWEGCTLIGGGGLQESAEACKLHCAQKMAATRSEPQMRVLKSGGPVLSMTHKQEAIPGAWLSSHREQENSIHKKVPVTPASHNKTGMLTFGVHKVNYFLRH